MDIKHIEDKFKIHDGILNKHDELFSKTDIRLDNLENFQATSSLKIDMLISQIQDLISTMKNGMGVLVSVLIGFFIWYIQSL